VPSDLMKLANINVKLDVKFKRDFGEGVITNAATGLVVTFATSFADVRSITTTAKYQAANPGAQAVYDFVDIPNPTTFTVYIYNTAGTRVTGTFSWSAEGV